MLNLRNLLALLVLIGGLSTCAECGAEFVTMEGSWYRKTSPGNLNTVADALDFIDGRIADATFGVIEIDYPAGNANTVPTSNTPLQSFLATNAYGLRTRSGADINDSLYRQLTNSVFVFSGSIEVDASHDSEVSDADIDVTFRVGSDDGFQLKIGENVIGAADVRPFRTTDIGYSFASAGRYDFELLYFERAGNTGVDVQWMTGGSGSFASLRLSAIPEPSTAALPTLAASLSCMKRRRRSLHRTSKADEKRRLA